MTGRTISNYRILEKLGEGGIGPSLTSAEARWGRNSFPKRPSSPIRPSTRCCQAHSGRRRQFGSNPHEREVASADL